MPIVANFKNQNDKNDWIYQFLTNLNKNQEYTNHYWKRKATLIAKYAPGFRDLLKKLGWSEDQLNKEIAPLGE